MRVVGTVEDISERVRVEDERKQAEAEIQQLNQQLTRRISELQTLFEVLPIGVAIGEDPECRVAHVNPCLSKMLNVPLGENASPSASPDDRPAYRVYRDGQELSAENLPMQYAAAHNVEVRDEIVDIIVHLDGTVVQLLSYASPLLDEQGKVRGVIGGFVDITDRNRAEIALQESEARFQEIAQTINQVVYVISLTTGQYLYISPSYERLWGYSCESLYQNPSSWLDRVHPEDLEYVLWGFNQLLSGNKARLQYRIMCPDGVRWIESESLVVYDEDGKPLRVVGLADDITDRKQLEEALRASEEQFRNAFDDAPIGVSLVSLTGQFQKVNTCYCDIVGYPEAELLKLNFRDITHPADLAADLEGLRQMLSGETPSFQIEKRYITKRGAIVPVLVNAAPVRDHNGKPLYVVAHIQDIRDRLKIQRLKDEFVSIISHELRTPLTSIRGALGILGAGVFDNRPEKAKHMLQVAINNSDRLVRLVDDILSLERLESGKVQLVMERCQLTDLMQQAVDSIQAIADQSAITLSLTALPISVWVAPDAIIQTLINLLSNAIKFSSPGDTVWLKAEMENAELKMGNGKTVSIPTPYLLFSITDQGRGIPPDKLEMIFEEFQQVDVSDSRKKGGTGLGLAICKKIVQQHGGQIWAESSLGKESTFYFALPLTGNNNILHE